MSAARSMSSRALITTWSSVGTGSVMNFLQPGAYLGRAGRLVSSRAQSPCHPERSEGSMAGAAYRSLAALGMTRVAQMPYVPSMRPNHPLSRIANQVMWDRLIAVVEEQAQTLVRTAFGTPTREAGDLSAGVYDTKGRMLAQAVTRTPGHGHSMAGSVSHVLNKIPLSEMHEGDVFILNDPWQGTGHLNDIVIVTPTYRQGPDGQKRAVGFFADTLHVVDIGGRGIVGAAQQVYEEGIYIPITKIVDRGRINQWLVDLIAANVREPGPGIGGLYSLISGNDNRGRPARGVGGG